MTHPKTDIQPSDTQTPDTGTLIQRYLDGETSLAEERQLALILSRKEILTFEEQIILAMLGELTVDEALYDEIMAKRKAMYHAQSTTYNVAPSLNTQTQPPQSQPLVPRTRILKMWPWLSAAACIATIAFLLGRHAMQDTPDSPTPQLATTVAPPPRPTAAAEEATKERATPDKEQAAPAKEPAAPIMEKPLLAEAKPRAIKPQATSTNTPALQAEPSPHPSQEGEVQLPPILHPERLEYTPEDVAALKQQAKQKYLEWIQLEREIMELEETSTAINYNE